MSRKRSFEVMAYQAPVYTESVIAAAANLIKKRVRVLAWRLFAIRHASADQLRRVRILGRLTGRPGAGVRPRQNEAEDGPYFYKQFTSFYGTLQTLRAAMRQTTDDWDIVGERSRELFRRGLD